jgi:hypothetical protein
MLSWNEELTTGHVTQKEGNRFQKRANKVKRYLVAAFRFASSPGVVSWFFF